MTVAPAKGRAAAGGRGHGGGSFGWRLINRQAAGDPLEQDLLIIHRPAPYTAPIS